MPPQTALGRILVQRRFASPPIGGLLVLCSKPTDVEWRFTEEGERVRVSLRSGRVIPLPSGSHELEDFVNPDTYQGKQLNDNMEPSFFKKSLL